MCSQWAFYDCSWSVRNVDAKSWFCMFWLPFSYENSISVQILLITYFLQNSYIDYYAFVWQTFPWGVFLLICIWCDYWTGGIVGSLFDMLILKVMFTYYCFVHAFTYHQEAFVLCKLGYKNVMYFMFMFRAGKIVILCTHEWYFLQGWAEMNFLLKNSISVLSWFSDHIGWHDESLVWLINLFMGHKSCV